MTGQKGSVVTRAGSERQRLDLCSVRKVHLVGVGGIGVSAVARLLLARGLEVSGCDVRESSVTRALREEGVRVFIGHSPEHFSDCDLLVFSSAIPPSNPEIEAARKVGLRLVHRSQVLQALMEGWTGIGVTGTNGKGTVSAIIAWLLYSAGFDPSFAIGAILHNFGTNARAGTGRYIVCELDESDGSFINVRPDRFVINNLEADHLNYYKDLEGLLCKFSEYLTSAGAPPIVHVNGDDKNIQEVLRRAQRKEVVTHGEGAHNTYVLSAWEGHGLWSRFRVFGPQGDLGWFTLGLPGHYNALNALAALGVVLEEGVDVEVARQALPEFKGMQNRFTVLTAGPLTLVKDYISHPVGIRSVLRAARDLGGHRVLAVFKPYRFTMIHYLQNEYREAFRDADFTFVTEMFTAGEDPIPGIDTQFLVEKIRSSGSRVQYVADLAELPEAVLEVANPGDIVVFFGGDDLFEVADILALRVRGLDESCGQEL